jgi:hypothetical protein
MTKKHALTCWDSKKPLTLAGVPLSHTTVPNIKVQVGVPFWGVGQQTPVPRCKSAGQRGCPTVPPSGCPPVGQGGTGTPRGQAHLPSTQPPPNQKRPRQDHGTLPEPHHKKDPTLNTIQPNRREVAEGVSDAFTNILDALGPYPMTRETILNGIQAGVTEAFDSALDGADILAAIEQGAYRATAEHLAATDNPRKDDDQ